MLQRYKYFRIKSFFTAFFSKNNEYSSSVAKEIGKVNTLGNITNDFILFCSRLFVTLPMDLAKLLRLGKKRNEFLCFALDFS